MNYARQHFTAQHSTTVHNSALHCTLCTGRPGFFVRDPASLWVAQYLRVRQRPLSENSPRTLWELSENSLLEAWLICERPSHSMRGLFSLWKACSATVWDTCFLFERPYLFVRGVASLWEAHCLQDRTVRFPASSWEAQPLCERPRLCVRGVSFL